MENLLIVIWDIKIETKTYQNFLPCLRMPDTPDSGGQWTEAESAKKKLRIQKYPNTCTVDGPGSHPIAFLFDQLHFDNAC